MTTESILTILALVIVAAVAVVAWRLRKKKDGPASSPAQATQPSAAPAPASKRLTAADYADSFFSGWLAGMPIKPYELPARIKGYGANGAYDRDKYDPRFYDALAQRILALVIVAAVAVVAWRLRKIAPTTMRQWLYGLSIDPSSAASMGLLAQALLDAPRSLGKRSLGAGQGDFGGGS